MEALKNEYSFPINGFTRNMTDEDVILELWIRYCCAVRYGEKDLAKQLIYVARKMLREKVAGANNIRKLNQNVMRIIRWSRETSCSPLRTRYYITTNYEPYGIYIHEKLYLEYRALTGWISNIPVKMFVKAIWWIPLSPILFPWYVIRKLWKRWRTKKR